MLQDISLLLSNTIFKLTERCLSAEITLHYDSVLLTEFFRCETLQFGRRIDNQ